MLGKRYCACRRLRRLGKDSYSDDENYRHSRELESVHARDHTPEQLIRSHFLGRIRRHSRHQFKRLSGRRTNPLVRPERCAAVSVL